MARVVVFANDFPIQLEYWRKIYDGLQLGDGYRCVFCNNLQELYKEVQRSSDPRQSGGDRLHAVVTDNSFGQVASGTGFVKALRRGDLGKDIAHIPVAIVSGGGAAYSLFALDPPPVALGRLDSGILARFLEGRPLSEAYNADRIRDHHAQSLLYALNPSHHEKTLLGRMLQWLTFWRTPEAARQSDPPHTYAAWVESLPPLERDGFMRERLEFIQYAFDNSFPWDGNRRLRPSDGRMRELREAVEVFDKHQPYISSDNGNNRLCLLLGEIRQQLAPHRSDHVR